MKNRKAKTFLPYLVLSIGLISVVVVILISGLPVLLSFEPIETIEEAKDRADKYLDKNFENLVVSEVIEFANDYYIITTEKNTENSALELIIDRYSGILGLEPGPNMMWNTKYGHHGRLDEPTTLMPIDSESAVMIAQDWLNRNEPGYRIIEITAFYGYYTMDFGEKGKIFGMLSVNGYSGDVWHHSWHGDFISMKNFS